MARGVKCVKYIGIADIRRISDADWDAIKIRLQGTVQWDKLNGFTVLGDRLRDDAVAYLRSDPEFVVVNEDPE
jgi:hypothetical protein